MIIIKVKKINDASFIHKLITGSTDPSSIQFIVTSMGVKTVFLHTEGVTVLVNV